ncbi:unnamed protein product [Penicillium pancosmium]
MTGFSKLLPVQKFRAAINRRKAGAKVQSRDLPGSSSSLGLTHADPPIPSPWGLPVEIQIQIFGYCGTADYLPLRLVCRPFNELLTRHEHEIVRQYLRQRRHGTLPSPIDNERTYTRNPEDDVLLLSDLFPPSKSARGGHLYTFRYLNGLRQRQKQSSKLCYYLADRIMDRFVQAEPIFLRTSFPSKKPERTALMKRGKASLWFHLAPIMYYILYYLESYMSARRENTNMLLREYEAGRLTVPIALRTRQQMYHDIQMRILQNPPFTNTTALLATHHCMHLLVSYIRYTMGSETEIDDSWISSLLTVAPFGRIVEFFSAEIGDGGNQRMQRKDFMYNFHRDMTAHRKDHMNSVIFAMAQASPAQLFNTSWTLHRLSPLHHGKDCETLLNNPTALKVYATRLRDQLTGDVLAGLHATATTAENDVLSKAGALKNCQWLPISTESLSNGHATFPGILITLEYENITYKAALLAGPEADAESRPDGQREGSTSLPLLMTKFPSALRQTFLSFLSANFDTYCSTLHLPSSFLCSGMESFIESLRGAGSRTTTSDDIVEEVVKDLQLTLAFSQSIAPALRSLNVNVSRTSLNQFLSVNSGRSKGRTLKQKLRSPFIPNLTSYLETHLAMKLDLDGSAQTQGAERHVRLSKVACAAFALGIDGRMKLTVADQLDDDEGISPAQQACEILLQATIRKAVIGNQAAT